MWGYPPQPGEPGRWGRGRLTCRVRGDAVGEAGGEGGQRRGVHDPREELERRHVPQLAVEPPVGCGRSGRGEMRPTGPLPPPRWTPQRWVTPPLPPPRLPSKILETRRSMTKLMVAMRTPRMKRKYQSSPTRKSCRFTHSRHPAGRGGQQGADTPHPPQTHPPASPPAPRSTQGVGGSHLGPSCGFRGRVSSSAPTPAPSPPPPRPPAQPAAPRGWGAPSRLRFEGTGSPPAWFCFPQPILRPPPRD